MGVHTDMYDDDSLEWESVRIDNSRPPLRWIANLAGHFASNAMMRMFDREENGIDSSFGYRIDEFIWDKLWPIYDRWGTFYHMKTEIDSD